MKSRTNYFVNFLMLLLLSIPGSTIAQQSTISLSSELRKLGDPGLLPQYESGKLVKQTSSYDTTGNNDDGFSGKYSFVRRNPDSSLVIFEAKGNGVINRIWTPTPNDDLLDFYFGGASKPNFTIRFSDLFSNKVFPFVLPLSGNQLGGYYSYLPIPFKNGCKIVSRSKKLEFYQIQYKSYPKNTKIQNFSMTLSPAETAAVKGLNAKWAAIQQQGISTRLKPAANQKNTVTQNVAGNAVTKKLVNEVQLQPGQSISMAEINTGGRINRLTISPASAFIGLQKQIDLKITWDDETQAAVYAPVADFFGYAFGSPSMQSLLMGYAGDTLYLNFPMPFDRKAKIELIYRNHDLATSTQNGTSTQQAQSQQTSGAQKIRMQVDYTNQQRDPAREGKFYSIWNKDANAPLGQPHVFAQGQAKGHYVGTILQAQGLEPGMTLFFEGDDQTTVDGQLTMHGTGSEDYFNGGWYALLDRWDTKMSMPLHGSLDYSLPFSRTGGYRLFLLDKLPFEKSLNHVIEHGPENNNKRVDYTSVALYYADKQLNDSQKAPENGSTKVYMPDTLMVYPQLMNYSPMGTITISGNTFTADNGGQLRINLAEIPNGKYKLYADLESNTEGAEVSLWQRQTLLRDSISFQGPKKELKSQVFLVPLEISDFKNTITINFKPDATKKKIWINRLILIRE